MNKEELLQERDRIVSLAQQYAAAEGLGVLGTLQAGVRFGLIAGRGEAIREIQHPGSCADCGHSSDCALHNEPALGIEPCNCHSRTELFPGTRDALASLSIREEAEA